MNDLRIRLAEDAVTAREVVQLQREAWGMPDSEVVPVPLLVTSAYWDGILIVAECGEEVVGFSYGILGREGDELLLCSHMLAVVPAYRGRGLGYRLKLAQREEAIRRGLNRVVWTFDPLEARNAFLNLHKLGVWVDRYFVNHYGDMLDDINRGIPSDRLLADWRTGRKAPSTGLDTPLVNPASRAGGLPVPGEILPEDAPSLLLAIPRSMDAIKRHDPDLALRWRLHVREAFETVLAAGYTATDLLPGDDELAFYVLHRGAGR